MIADLKPYPAMKYSGLAWTGEIPEHWLLVPNRAMLRQRKVLVGDCHSEYQLLSLTKAGVIVRDISTGRGKFSADMGTSQEVRVGDLVFCLFDVPETPRTVGLSQYNGMITGAYTVFECRDSRLARFLEAFYVAMDDRKLLSPLYSGLRNTIPPSTFLGTKTPTPPLRERAAIVRFLDYADRRIRRYILAKQKLVKLLEEQKQAIIHRAVTRGLDPNVRLKPSGVESLGDVPEHWRILPLKRWVATKITDGPHETPEWLDDGVPFLSAEAMVNGRLEFNRRRGFISPEVHEVYCRKCRPQRNDIFMCKSGATTGKVAIVETDDEFSVWSPLALIRVRPERVLPRLLFAVLKCRYVQRQVEDTWSYGTQPNLSMGAMERLTVALPPINEQVALLAYIAQETTKPTEAIDRAQREIALLREYRTRLIADVVTGKLDVREAAARLPGEVEEAESHDEADTIPKKEDDGPEAIGATLEEAEA